MKQYEKNEMSRREFVQKGSWMIGGVLMFPAIAGKAQQPLLNAAVFGDSAMWGQGLKKEDKYAENAIIEIGKLLGRSTNIKINLAHSGAPIRTDERAKESFLMTFPKFWKEQPPEAIFQFLKKNDQHYAQQIYQEIPCAFPTISYQVQSITAEDAENIQLVIMNGGANDLDFEKFLNPKDYRTNFVEHYDQMLQEFTYLRVKSLLHQTRVKFPNAVLIYTGYFSPFYPGVSNDEMKTLLYHLADAQGYEVTINEAVKVKDADQYVREAQHRAIFGFSRSLYWMRKAIIETMRDQNLLGPGILFVHPLFTAENAAFQPDSFFHNDYKLSEIKDPARKERDRNIVRNEEFDNMHKLRAGLKSLTHGINYQQSAKQLLERIDGPFRLNIALKNFIKSPGDVVLRHRLLDMLETEMSRIINARRASFLHPNERGADRYVKEIVKRYTEKIHQVDLERDLSRFPGLHADQQQNTNFILHRYGLEAFKTHPAIIPQLMSVDSIALHVATAADSEPHIADDFFLELGVAHRWQLNFPYRFYNLSQTPPKSPSILHHYFKPGKGDLITIDGMGMHLSEITRFTIERKEAADIKHALVGTKPWKVTKVKLYLNGIKVFEDPSAKTLKRGEKISFSFPIRANS